MRSVSRVGWMGTMRAYLELAQEPQCCSEASLRAWLEAWGDEAAMRPKRKFVFWIMRGVGGERGEMSCGCGERRGYKYEPLDGV